MSSKPHDAEAEPALEVAFGCCGPVRMILHSALIPAIQAGFANSTPVPDPITGNLDGSNYVGFWLTADPANGLGMDVDYRWNPELEPKVGVLTMLFKPLDNAETPNPLCGASAQLDNTIQPPPAGVGIPVTE